MEIVDKKLNVEQKYLDLANKLDALQASKNNGRGVGHVRTIVAFLKAGMLDEAKAVCYNEGDKMRSYPDIMTVVEEELLEGPLFKSLKFFWAVTNLDSNSSSVSKLIEFSSIF
mgnify:CR=1 FL=1